MSRWKVQLRQWHIEHQLAIVLAMLIGHVLPPDKFNENFPRFIRLAADICSDENVTVVSDMSELDNENYTNPSKAHNLSQ